MTDKVKPLCPERLMRIRYEVIADFPGNTQGVGVPFEALPGPFFEKYSHIYRQLQWWEKREEAELPVYIKMGEGGPIKKVVKYLSLPSLRYSGIIEHSAGLQSTFHLKDYLPATETEYLSQQNNNTNDK